ncbi:cytochrome c biogenesis protein ResB [Rhodoluna sp.]|uniref:cytochrome c biogenesis protein ResB n=1 Tax=Rhodoluna sp. TaxID=1969481 RepID=UPI0025E0353B|nr:cytochrome c biogenesis protein ResB [Rhodoluna sp.]
MPSSQQSRPSLDAPEQPINSPTLSVAGWSRWIWRQITSMRTALLLLLMLAVAAVPGSVFPQRSADPNGVTQYFDNNPQLAPVLDAIQLFDVYTSAWFSAIYILLFISLIGCVVPRTLVHAKALRSAPPAAPRLFSRMPASLKVKTTKAQSAKVAEQAQVLLKKQGYRVVRTGDAVSAERGYLRETGNLVFHLSLIGVLLAVGIGGGQSYSGQRVLVEGETFVNNLAGFDSFAPGTFFKEEQLVPFSVTLDKFEVDFDFVNQTNIGTPLDFRASVSALIPQSAQNSTLAKKTGVIRVNEPLAMPGSNIYLTGNGYAPEITIRDKKGNITYSGATAFLPQSAKYTSLGVIKVPDVEKQFGIISFFYPTVAELDTGALTSLYPAPIDPLLTMNVYVGDLGLDGGSPKNVYALDTSAMTQVAGGKSGVKGLRLQLGETVKLPGDLGTVTFDSLKRFASLDVSYNPGGFWVLVFALMALGGVTLSLLVPRRRVWVRKTETGFEVAALARGDDPILEKVVAEVAEALSGKTTKTTKSESK